MLFGRKKKALFGKTVEPRCEYCQHNTVQGGRSFCVLRQERRDGKCKKYAYDPLKREPRTAPPLKEYDPDEFKL